jgi:hypothetical protein
MPNAIERRRTRFLRALAATGQSQSAWARANGLTKGHLSLVLNGKRDSDTLNEKINAFIREHAKKPAALAS